MVPYFLPMGGKVLVRQTSSTHGADGYITTDPNEIAKGLERLKKKLLSSVGQYCFYEDYPADDTDTLILTYGVTARAARVAVNRQKQAGKPISLLVLKTLWPVPEDLIRERAKKVKRVVVIEMNLGLYVREMRRILPDKTVDFWGQMNGRLITPRQIMEVIDHA
jgi:2-oxoglutarate ferredoxin oxidoreductase subunit alpha